MADERGRKSLSRKSKKTKISRPENDEEPQTCVICLDKVSCRGKLGACQHWFCFSCIFEWSKNTNSCPVCKMTFRCISKIHLVAGKSPVKKVRVKDVDQRVYHYQDDEDFIWAELESSHEDLSDYEPPSHDDANDTTFYPSPIRSDSDDTEVMVIDSDVYCDSSSDETVVTSTDEEEMSCSDFLSHSESENNWSPVFQKKSARTTTVSDSEDSSDAQIDDEWRSKGTNKKSHGKRDATNGFHKNPQKPQKSTNRKFEAELQRRKHASHSRTKTNEKKSTSRKKYNSQGKDSAGRGGCSSSIGQWLRTASARSQPTSSRSGRTQSQDLSRQRRTRITNSFRSDEETSVRMEIPYESTRSESISARNKSSSSRNKSSSSRNESSSARNKPSSSRKESISARNKSSSARNETIFTLNESRSTRNESRSQQSVLPKTRSHKKLTFTIESDSDSYSSCESSNQLSEFSRKPKVSENLRQNTSSKRSENKRRDLRSSRVLKEVQNFYES